MVSFRQALSPMALLVLKLTQAFDANAIIETEVQYYWNFGKGLGRSTLDEDQVIEVLATRNKSKMEKKNTKTRRKKRCIYKPGKNDVGSDTGVRETILLSNNGNPTHNSTEEEDHVVQEKRSINEAIGGRGS